MIERGHTVLLVTVLPWKQLQIHPMFERDERREMIKEEEIERGGWVVG